MGLISGVRDFALAPVSPVPTPNLPRQGIAMTESIPIKLARFEKALQLFLERVRADSNLLAAVLVGSLSEELELAPALMREIYLDLLAGPRTAERLGNVLVALIGRHHRSVRLGKVLPGIRHPLRGVTAPFAGLDVRLCQALRKPIAQTRPGLCSRPLTSIHGSRRSLARD